MTNKLITTGVLVGALLVVAPLVAGAQSPSWFTGTSYYTGAGHYTGGGGFSTGPWMVSAGTQAYGGSPSTMLGAGGYGGYGGYSSWQQYIPQYAQQYVYGYGMSGYSNTAGVYGSMYGYSGYGYGW